MIDNSYEDTSIFIFHVWVFAGYITIPYNQVSFLSRTQLLRSGHPLWPWTIVCSLLSTSNLLPHMPLATKGCEALSFRWLYEHLSVANKVTNNLHEFSCHSIIRWAGDGQSPYCWLRCVFRLQNAFSSQSLRHYTTLPIDRTNDYEYSYRPHTNKPFGSSPDFLTEHSAF